MRTEEPDLAPQPEPASTPSRAARVLAQRHALDAQRARGLDRFDRLDGRDVALGEVAHGVVAVGADECPGAAGGKLHVQEVPAPAGMRSADGGDVGRTLEIAHESFGNRLAEGADDQRLQGAAHLADRAARGRRAGVHDGAERRRHRQRAHRARVDRPLGIQQRLGHGEHRGRRRRRSQVGRAGDLRRAAAEVGGQGVAVHGEAQPERQRLGPVTGVVEIRLVRVDPVGHLADRFAHADLGPVQERRHRFARGRDAPPLQHAVQAPLRDPASADHRLQIPAALLRLADVREQQVGGLLDRHAAALDADAGDAHALLEDLGGGSREAAGDHPADVLPVGHDAEMGDEDVAAEHGRVQRHVVEVRTACIGIVVQEQVAGADVALVAGDHAARRPRQGREMRGLLDLGGGDQLARRRQHGAGEVVPLVDHRRAGGADHDAAHLAHHRREARLDQLQHDGVDHTAHVVRESASWRG